LYCETSMPRMVLMPEVSGNDMPKAGLPAIASLPSQR